MPMLFAASALCLALLGCTPSGNPDESRETAFLDSQTPDAVPPDTMQLPETNYYEISTPLGRMVVRLFDETPTHRDNFKKLAAESFYDGTTFHRVISGFMIQGGDPNSRDDDPRNDGAGGPGYTLPAEIQPSLYHRRGVLAAARQGDHVNPERRSSGSQFYIVQGARMDSTTLAMVERDIRTATRNPDFAFSPEVRAVYQQEGGAPNLDRQYTVFGEVVEGLDVLDQIASTETPRRLRQQAPPDMIDRPLQSIPMTVRPLPDYEEAAP